MLRGSGKGRKRPGADTALETKTPPKRGRGIARGRLGTLDPALDCLRATEITLEPDGMYRLFCQSLIEDIYASVVSVANTSTNAPDS